MFLKTKFMQTRPGTGLQATLYQGTKRMKGSNNCVSIASEEDIGSHAIDEHGRYAIRTPLSDSDTRQVSFAREEARFALLAAYSDVGPNIYDIWYASKSTKEQKKGLHMVMDYFSMDLHELIFRHTDWMLQNKGKVASAIEACAMKLARLQIFSYDIKSANIVVNTSPFDLKFIDFSNTYCEWCKGASKEESVYKMLQAHTKNSSLIDVVIASTMLIILSANIGIELYEHRKKDNTTYEDRVKMHVLRDKMRSLRSQSPAYTVYLIKCVLRNSNVKECLDHYLGKRNSGTRRVFDYAHFTR